MPQRILALETSGREGSVAALDGEQLLGSIELDPRLRSAQSLAPAMQTLLQQVAWRPGDVSLVAVTVGPGSFTGLRVGVTTAKAFAYAVGSEIIGIDTLDVIAAQAPLEDGSLSVALDAQRGDVFACDYRVASGRATALGPARIVAADAWSAALPAGTWVSGPALEKLRSQLPGTLAVVDSSWWQPRAATVGRLAAAVFAAGMRDDVWRIAPKYLRSSAAEEKWQQKHRTTGTSTSP